MKLMLLILFFCKTVFSFGQNDRHLRDYFQNSFSYPQMVKNLKSYELRISKVEREIKFTKFKKYLKSLYPKDENFEHVESNEVVFIDLNADGFDDVIYLNSIGLPGTYIYFGTDETYKKVSSSNFNLEYITELNFESRKCIRIVLSYDDNYIPFGEKAETVYNLMNDSFQLKNYRFSRKCTFVPKLYFEKPINLKVIYHSTPLRENPKNGKGECFFKQKEDPLYNDQNNIIGRYFKETKCYAWAEHISANGKVWYLVEMPQIHEVLSKKKYSNDFKGIEKSYLIGWMEAKYLEKIK